MHRENGEENRRRYFRLRYPVAARPVLHLRGRRYPVTEISEEGLRILPPDSVVASDLPTRVDAEIEFTDGDTIRIHARQYRIEPKGVEVVLILGARIPTSRIIAEQRRILRNFSHEVVTDRD